VSESNVVVIITDMLADVLGYDKYQDITTEHAIRGSYVDLAVETDGELRFLIEVKAIGLELKDSHVKQSVDYGANKGAEWVILTNGAIWRIYKIIFGQPIDKTLVCELNILSSSPRDAGIIECFGNLSREGFSKGSMAELAQQKMVTSKFAVANILLGDAVLEELRRELRRLSPGLRTEVPFLRELLEREVLKRDLVEGEDANAAAAAIKRLQRSLARERDKKKSAVTSLGGANTDDSAGAIAVAAAAGG
jgi:predicted type IV restriction endonuclease